MSIGKCVKCGSSVGGIFTAKLRARKCTNPGCGKMFCWDCCDKVGLLHRDTVCPICGNPAEAI